MNIPKKIKDLIYEANRLYKTGEQIDRIKARAYIDEINSHMSKYGCHIWETYGDGSGFGLDELENSDNEFAAENFICYMRNEFDMYLTYKERKDKVNIKNAWNLVESIELYEQWEQNEEGTLDDGCSCWEAE